MPLPNTSGSISKQIAYGKSLEISHSKLHFKSRLTADKDVIFNYSSILDKYYDLIKRNTVERVLTDNELIRYRFQPKLLSYDAYGTTELWSALLKVNNIVSSAQFNKQVIRIFTDDIFDILNEIIILEENEIRRNTSDVYST